MILVETYFVFDNEGWFKMYECKKLTGGYHYFTEKNNKITSISLDEFRELLNK